jgi:UDP-N-acetyl-D-mannosaminuronic acid dehydrogenase
MGLGYIGLPTSAFIASKGTKVLGVDINHHIVDTVNQGKVHIVEPELDKIVSIVVSNGLLKASSIPNQADVFLILVPTPFKKNYEPDISNVESAINTILPFLKQGDLIIIESTSPIGTTDKMANLIFSLRPDLLEKIYIAYCPERVLPGNILHELLYNDRVIGGINRDSTQKAIDFYSKYVKGELFPTNARTAEMCKLVENSSRDVQIAFSNEISLICDKAEINVWDLINLANKHPRVNILQPGCGVGGHCIAVDPYFIVSDYPNESKIIKAARDVNIHKSDWCAEKIITTTQNFEFKHNRPSKIAIMGLSFKPNIDDLRESPALKIALKILNYFNKENVYLVEPNIENHKLFQITNYEYAISNADIIIFLVWHKQFKNLDISKNKVVIDFCGIYNSI